MPALNLNGCCCDMANQIATFTASLEDGAPTKRKQPKQHGTSQSHASLKGHTSHAMHRSSRRQSRRQSSGPTGDVLRMWSPSGLPKPTGHDCIARSQLPRERERGLSYRSQLHLSHGRIDVYGNPLSRVSSDLKETQTSTAGRMRSTQCVAPRGGGQAPPQRDAGHVHVPSVH